MYKRLKSIHSVRLYTLGIGCLIASLLYQTDINHMGTKIALGSMFLVVLGTIININNSRCKKSATFISLVVLFVLTSLISTLYNGTSPHYLNRYIAFFITYVFICNFKISIYENEILKDIFSIAMSIYAVLTSYSYIYNPITTNYIHSDVELFGTLMDPNYISIPFVAAANLCTSRIIEKKDIIINIVMLIINLLAILCAASRGAVVAMIISIVLHFCLSKKISVSKIIFIGFIILIIQYIFLPIVKVSFGEQFIRMSEFGIEDDSGRFELWNKAIELFISFPILGIGLGGMVDAAGHAAHNTYVQVLTETGIFGFILFTILVYKMLKRVFVIDKQLFIMFAGYLVQIFFVDALGDRLLWIMFIWIAVITKNKENLETKEQRL